MITSKWKNIRNESRLLQLAAIEVNCADLSTATAYSGAWWYSVLNQV